jgi:hypothetical protein
MIVTSPHALLTVSHVLPARCLPSVGAEAAIKESSDDESPDLIAVAVMPAAAPNLKSIGTIVAAIAVAIP